MQKTYPFTWRNSPVSASFSFHAGTPFLFLSKPEPVPHHLLLLSLLFSSQLFHLPRTCLCLCSVSICFVRPSCCCCFRSGHQRSVGRPAFGGAANQEGTASFTSVSGRPKMQVSRRKLHENRSTFSSSHRIPVKFWPRLRYQSEAYDLYFIILQSILINCMIWTSNLID